ncbi:hypothetical protein DFJ69_5540 [Thermomonospora umbrina]|uniref:Uncharacterized protein n=1 Tax=Thermomonospora umbrina TaxID=111806 RepID=A0A3D9SVN2_9ACTN|nr:hypothetical protein DFJ69_5540 [Thermomonospora umbrina]
MKSSQTLSSPKSQPSKENPAQAGNSGRPAARSTTRDCSATFDNAMVIEVGRIGIADRLKWWCRNAQNRDLSRCGEIRGPGNRFWGNGC